MALDNLHPLAPEWFYCTSGAHLSSAYCCCCSWHKNKITIPTNIERVVDLLQGPGHKWLNSQTYLIGTHPVKVSAWEGILTCSFQKIFIRYLPTLSFSLWCSGLCMLFNKNDFLRMGGLCSNLWSELLGEGDHIYICYGVHWYLNQAS